MILRQGVEQPGVARWVGHVHPIGHHAQRGTAHRERAVVGGSIYSVGAARDHGHPPLGQLGGEIRGNARAVARSSSRSDDGHRSLHHVGQVARPAKP